MLPEDYYLDTIWKGVSLHDDVMQVVGRSMYDNIKPLTLNPQTTISEFIYTYTYTYDLT